MKLPPKEITLCNLEVIVMPNGEILCLGVSLGYFQRFAKALSVKKEKERES